ncbi:MAG TPA: Crp/Fnr family transcriptional regulator [Puia sp.]|jgi:CRP-like cAMP-binding protein|nr:Crp/Fnr family transcriptional regulator [Puia sp.]
MEEIIALLNSVHHMPKALQLRLWQMAKRKEVPRKTILLSPGDICNYLYYIEKGILACHHHEDGKSYCTWLMTERDIATSVKSFNDQVPSTESIEAVEDSILWVISKQELEELSEQFKVFRNIRQRLTDKYHKQCRDLDAQRKRTPEQFYDYLSENFPEFPRRVPNHILASYMGIAESTLYKIKKDRRNHR